jgi:primosomal protein N' (replication factor Y)
VVIQTYSPDHYAIRPVSGHDYEGFYAEELGHRAALGYPPFGYLAHALVSGAEEAKARAAANLVAGAVAPGEGVELLGPAPAPLARLRGRYRFQILVKGTDQEVLRRAAEQLRTASARLGEGLQASLDLRPLNML